MGKSVMGLTLARGIAEQGRGVLMFSLEMPEREVQARLAADVAYSPHIPDNGEFGGNVVQVRLTEDPAGQYWGWLHFDLPGRDAPTMVQPHKGMFKMQFPYGPQAEEEAGKGRTVRLTVSEIQP